MAGHNLTIPSSNVKQTQHLARQLAAYLHGGEIILLRGELGVGKTSFTQGLAKGMGIERTVNSPTFTIIKEYQGTSLPLYHMDAYRLEDEAEDLGLEEYFYGSGVCVIEWPEQIAGQLPPERLEITLRKTGEQEREIDMHPVGGRYEHLLEQIRGSR